MKISAPTEPTFVVGLFALLGLKCGYLFNKNDCLTLPQMTSISGNLHSKNIKQNA
jgi:hypothetical protein